MSIWTADNSFLLEYRERCKTGEIIIGTDLRTELENLSEDIKSERFIYNRDDALLRMDFLENCVRLTKSPFYNKPMVLMLWQKAMIEALYSFKTENKLRRFWNLLLMIGRKNTKSELCSGLGLSEFFLGNPGADIVASSNDDAQASIVYDGIDTMRQLIDPRNEDSKRNQRFILNRSTNTKIFKLSDRTRNKEGRNIDVAFLDEVHEMKDNTIAKSIEQSQSLKDEPLFVRLTTEGFVSDGYLDEELAHALAVIYGEAEDIRILPWIYTQDSENEVWDGTRENRLWMKSNPTLGTIKKWDFLEAQVEKARESKADRIFTLCKDFNIKQNGAQAWLNLEDYDYECSYDLEAFRESYAVGAVDLAETTDLVAAKILMMKEGDPNKYILSHYFIPEAKLEDSDDKDAGAKYKEWAENGYMTISEGNDVDLAIVADWFYALYTDHGIRVWRVGYDQRFSKDWITRMEYYGWMKSGGDDSDLVMVNQNALALSSAIKLAEADLKSQLVRYDNNPVDKWNLSNAGIKVDDRGLCLIIKQEAHKRIDGAVALAIVYEMYKRCRTEYRALIGG